MQENTNYFLHIHDAVFAFAYLFLDFVNNLPSIENTRLFRKSPSARAG